MIREERGEGELERYIRMGVGKHIVSGGAISEFVALLVITFLRLHAIIKIVVVI